MQNSAMNKRTAMMNELMPKSNGDVLRTCMDKVSMHHICLHCYFEFMNHFNPTIQTLLSHTFNACINAFACLLNSITDFHIARAWGQLLFASFVNQKSHYFDNFIMISSKEVFKFDM